MKALRGLLLAGALAATPARADVAEVVNGFILPGYAAFDQAAAALADAAAATCDIEALRVPFNTAWDAWMGVAHLHFGPVEDRGRALAIAFWPDPKGLGTKAQKALLTGDPALLAPDAFAEQSVAARGFSGLERLLYPAAPPEADPCPLIRATAADLARMAHEVHGEWIDGFADVLLTAGETGNATYLTADEARQALFTQIATGLEFSKDSRLGRPLGTFDRPRPELAEARAAGRSLHNVVLSLHALRAMTADLSPDAAQTLAALDHAIAVAEALDDPVFAGVGQPGTRLKVEILQQSIGAARDKALLEMAPQLGVDLGFNAADGD
jgi:hypothetical protein